ncbi:uncharacterized protein LOC62_01G000438 [Vanrija pseudolonga]|uniref:Uncharacterized protein n=1 Tax=Vanrija pseudolonga TaxID=143232 RepID=A0AAF0Y509_9TREE|nr:hypothetical protein LOC62_01G000438 [Vanrija pseudolonga]
MDADQYMGAGNALALVPPGTALSVDMLFYVLSLWPSARSQATVLRLIGELDGESIATHMRLIVAYIGAAGLNQTLVFVRPAVELALRRIDEALAADLTNETAAKAVENTITYHDALLRALTAYSTKDAYYRDARDLPPHVQHLVGVVVKHLIASLDSVPSSSSAEQRPSIGQRSATLDALFSPRMLVPESVPALIAHCESTGVRMKPAYWRQATIIAVYGEDHDAAVEYVSRLEQGEEGHELAHLLITARVKTNVTEIIETLVPLLQADRTEKAVADSEDGGPSTVERAWCFLLSRACADPAVTSQEIVNLANTVPEWAISAFSLTPTIYALTERGDVDTALEIWGDLVHRHRLAGRKMRRQLIDAAALSVGADAMYASEEEGADDPLARSIKLVDFYAAVGTLAARDAMSDTTDAVPLDTQVLNTLLRLCERAGRPGTAFRLWHAAPLRWGVKHDDISLTLLLNTARHNSHDGELDLFRQRLRLLRDALGTQHSDDEVAAEPTTRRDAEWRTGPSTVLIDGPRYTWRDEHGSVRPHEKARAVFRDVVLGNWPSLLSVRSPLDHPTGAFATFSGFISPPSALAADDGEHPHPPPSGDAKYPHIIPTQASWNSYVGLLGGFDRVPEIPAALAWMRALATPPWRQTMAVALMHIGEHEGPRRRVRWASGETALARDEEIMRAWLVEWLGEDAVPTEEEVAEYRRARTSQPLTS